MKKNNARSRTRWRGCGSHMMLGVFVLDSRGIFQIGIDILNKKYYFVAENEVYAPRRFNDNLKVITSVNESLRIILIKRFVLGMEVDRSR